MAISLFLVKMLKLTKEIKDYWANTLFFECYPNSDNLILILENEARRLFGDEKNGYRRKLILPLDETKPIIPQLSLS